MTFAEVETLKQAFTDKYVLVEANVPELRRFQGLTGTVKTVNMSGRALVQFDHPVDVGWYDIDLSFLKVVAQPLPKAAPAASKPEAAAEKKSAPVAKPAGKSPLEMARAQGAAGSTPAAKPAAAGGMSKLEQARAAGALKAAGTTPPATPAAATPPSAPEGKPLSKLELARMQGAKGSAPTAAASAPSPAAVAPPAPPAAPVPAPAPAAPVSLTDAEGKPLSKLELARRQGAAKKS